MTPSQPVERPTPLPPEILPPTVPQPEPVPPEIQDPQIPEQPAPIHEPPGMTPPIAVATTMFESASQTVSDPKFKAWIDKTLPRVREHLSVAQRLQSSMSSAKTGLSTAAR